jgi:hypothetical protein
MLKFEHRSKNFIIQNWASDVQYYNVSFLVQERQFFIEKSIKNTQANIFRLKMIVFTSKIDIFRAKNRKINV